MGDLCGLVFSGIAPHPPIMVPEVGGAAISEVRGSIEAMAEFTRRIIDSGAETIVLISPHAPLDRHAFVAYQGPLLAGSFAGFRAPDANVKFPLDKEILGAIEDAARIENYAVKAIENQGMDHGTAVPLYFLQRNGWIGSVVGFGYSLLSNEDHLKFGACVRQAITKIGRPVAFIASGDLSHRLKPGAPAGYNPDAHAFDEQVVEAIRHNSPESIIDIDPDLRRLAGECGYRSMLVALGATRDLPVAAEVLNYEAPFGVGYLVAQLTNARANGGRQETRAVAGRSTEEYSLKDLPQLARQSVETFVLTGKPLSASYPSGASAVCAACFVSIKTLAGELRGCIGTIEPTQETLAKEVMMNAVSAATRDPRFKPVTAEELANLRYSVDILSASEPTTLEDLNPANYGVIVEDETGDRRGLLLPDIEGVDTAARQVEIAARKAGIPPGKLLKLSRFKVERFREGRGMIEQ